jgi:predicted O-methyltransferase YrrM
MDLNQAELNAKIEELKKAAPSYQFKEANLAKFGTSEDQQVHLGYVRDGVGGFYPKFLAAMVKEFQFKNIVELGNEKGFSTLAMYDALPEDSSFITIDLLKDQRYCPDAMFTDPRVKFIFGDVSDLSIFKGHLPMDIDLLFTDTIHFNFQISDEFEIYQHLLADKAIVAIDDINLNDKRLFFDRMPYAKWDLTEVCHVSGWGLFLYERKEKLSIEERTLKAFQASAKIWYRKFLELETAKNEREERMVMNRLKKFVRHNPQIHKAVIAIRRVIKL